MAARGRSVAGRRGTAQKRKPPGQLVQKKTQGRKWRKAPVLISIVALGLLAGLFLDCYRIPSRSMEDTILYGDYLLIEKLSYGAQIPFTNLRFPAVRAPRPGDVIIFRSPDSPRLYAKRCVAVAGQRVEVRTKALFVDGGPVSGPPVLKIPRSPGIRGRRELPGTTWGRSTFPRGICFSSVTTATTVATVVTGDPCLPNSQSGGRSWCVGRLRPKPRIPVTLPFPFPLWT